MMNRAVVAALVLASACATSSPTATSSPHEVAGSEGLRVRVTAPETVRTAELVEVEVAVTDDRGVLGDVIADWGDPPVEFAHVTPACVPREGPQPALDTTRTLRHGYRAEGTYELRVQVITGMCDRQETVLVEEIMLKVEPGATPSNGPVPPRARLDDRRELRHRPQQAEGVFWIGGGDDDGYVARIDVEWGDGDGRRVYEADLADCDDDPEHWPDTYEVGDEVEHRYAKPGSYRVVVTVVSTGCDGGDRQERARAFTVVVTES